VPSISLNSASENSAIRTHSAIVTASAKTGVDFSFLVNQARAESGMDPHARAATSSASGLFQFTGQTWLNTVKAHGAKHGLSWAADAITARRGGGLTVRDNAVRDTIMDLRMQPETAAVMAAELASDNYDTLKEHTGKEPEQVDLYLAHFLGENAAIRFLNGFHQRPGSPAAEDFPAAAAANRAVFFNPAGDARSYRDIRENFARKFDRDQTATTIVRNLLEERRSLRNAAPLPPNSEIPHAAPPRQLQMLAIQKMPQRLSLDFAQSTYQRLASLGQGADT
jgi:hypothetical protein